MSLLAYQSLWATELRRPGIPERPIPERFDRVRGPSFDTDAMRPAQDEDRCTPFHLVLSRA